MSGSRRQLFIVDDDGIGRVPGEVLRVSAITTATACPTKRTVSGAIAGQAPIFIGVPSFEVMAQPQMRLPTLSSTSSLPVSTAITPGIFIASDESMLLTLACACGLRTNWAKVMPTSLISST